MIRPEFKQNTLNEYGRAMASDIRIDFSDLLEKLDKLVPPCRERSLMLTHLQEACNWAVSGLAAQPANQLA